MFKQEAQIGQLLFSSTMNQEIIEYFFQVQHIKINVWKN